MAPGRHSTQRSRERDAIHLADTSSSTRGLFDFSFGGGGVPSTPAPSAVWLLCAVVKHQDYLHAFCVVAKHLGYPFASCEVVRHQDGIDCTRYGCNWGHPQGYVAPTGKGGGKGKGKSKGKGGKGNRETWKCQKPGCSDPQVLGGFRKLLALLD